MFKKASSSAFPQLMLNLLVIIWREHNVSIMQRQIEFPFFFNLYFGFRMSEPHKYKGEKHCLQKLLEYMNLN